MCETDEERHKRFMEWYELLPNPVLKGTIIEKDDE